MLACANGYLDIVQYLLTSKDLKKHSRINEQDKNDCDALTHACKYGHLDVVRYLLTSHELSEHAKIYQKDTKWNPLMWACYYEQEEIIFYLIIDKIWRLSKMLKAFV